MTPPFSSHSTALKATVRFIDGVKASSSQRLLQPKKSLPLVLPRCSNTPARSGLLVAIAKSSGTSSYHSVLGASCPTHEVHVHKRFVSHSVSPGLLAKYRNLLASFVSTLFRGILEEHSLHVINVSQFFFSFIRLHLFFSFYFEW